MNNKFELIKDKGFNIPSKQHSLKSKTFSYFSTQWICIINKNDTGHTKPINTLLHFNSIATHHIRSKTYSNRDVPLRLCHIIHAARCQFRIWWRLSPAHSLGQWECREHIRYFPTNIVRFTHIRLYNRTIIHVLLNSVQILMEDKNYKWQVKIYLGFTYEKQKH